MTLKSNSFNSVVKYLSYQLRWIKFFKNNYFVNKVLKSCLIMLKTNALNVRTYTKFLTIKSILSCIFMLFFCFGGRNAKSSSEKYGDCLLVAIFFNCYLKIHFFWNIFKIMKFNNLKFIHIPFMWNKNGLTPREFFPQKLPCLICSVVWCTIWCTIWKMWRKNNSLTNG